MKWITPSILLIGSLLNFVTDFGLSNKLWQFFEDNRRPSLSESWTQSPVCLPRDLFKNFLKADRSTENNGGSLPIKRLLSVCSQKGWGMSHHKCLFLSNDFEFLC